MRAAVRTDQSVEFGKEWQGQTVDGRYPLHLYLGGSPTVAVFATNLPADAKTRAVIKLIRADRAESDEMLALWKRASQFSHSHLLRVFDGGRTWLSGNELLFVVTEFADENVAQVLPYRALTTSEADAMLAPTLKALAYLHEQNLVHAHLHPGNLMAVGDQVKLSTEGIRAAGTMLKHSPAAEYDAPECGTGTVSPKSDMWSLGVMLTEVLTQQRKPGAKGAMALPSPYAEIVKRCLVEDPEKRASVRDIAALVHVELPVPGAGETEVPKTAKRNDADRSMHPTLQPAAVTDQASRGSRRISGVIFFLVVAAILAITLTVKLMNQRSRVPEREQSAPASSAKQDEPAKEPLASVSAVKTDGPRVQQPRVAPSGNQSGAVLHQVVPDVSSGSLRTIQGHVKVRVRVSTDASGNVTDARFVSAGPSQYFARHSMDAARQWKFASPTENGQARPSEWNLLFEFSRGGVKAIPEQVKGR